MCSVFAISIRISFKFSADRRWRFTSFLAIALILNPWAFKTLDISLSSVSICVKMRVITHIFSPVLWLCSYSYYNMSCFMCHYFLLHLYYKFISLILITLKINIKHKIVNVKLKLPWIINKKFITENTAINIIFKINIIL